MPSMNQEPARIAGWLRGNVSALRFAVRVVVAGVAAFAIASLLALPQGFWAVVTAVIVVQASLGASLKASLDRLIGTIGGAVFGGLCAYFIPHADPIGMAVALAVALAPLGVIAAIDGRFRIAPVTAAILILVPSATGAGPLVVTGQRILEIAIGGAVAVVVSLLVLPSRAHGVLAASTNRLLGLLADLMPLLLGDLTAAPDRPSILARQAAIRRALAALDGAADEARRERRVHLTDDPDPDPVVRTATRVRHDVSMIGRALATPLSEPFATRLGPAAAAVGEASVDLLRGIAAAFAGRIPPPSAEPLSTALDTYNRNVEAVRVEGLTRGLSADAVGRLFTLGFALDQFRQDLGDLAARAAEFAGAEIPSAGEWIKADGDA